MAIPNSSPPNESPLHKENYLFDEMKHSLEMLDGLRKKLQDICVASSEMVNSLEKTRDSTPGTYSKKAQAQTKRDALKRLDQCKNQILSCESPLPGKSPFLGMHILGSREEIYQLSRLLKIGGMGLIFLAKRLTDNKDVVVKFLFPAKMQDSKEVLRFIMESQALIALEHENLVEGLDFNYTSQYIYYVMEYLDGETIQERLDREGVIDFLVSAKIILDIAYALEYLNNYGLVHRDIKPGNIFICTGNKGKLLDFGIAKTLDFSMTSKGIVIGTPHYLSPEQATLSSLDIRSDIYGLGATFYHMVVGQLPFDGDSITDVISRRLYQNPNPKTERPNLPSVVCNIIGKMMERNIYSRYQSPSNLIEDLKNFIEGISR